MLSRKSKDKSMKDGVVGKYVKKDTPPEIPSQLKQTLLIINCVAKIFINNHLFLVINVWTVEENKNKIKNRRNSQQITTTNTISAEPANLNSLSKMQTSTQKFGNGKVATKVNLGHEGKYTPSSSVPNLVHRLMKFNFKVFLFAFN